MLEKVFFNLFDNAVRHGERVTAITVSCEVTGGKLVITVQDNGIGIPPDAKQKIFEKGYGKNTGFGLFLAREILAITGISIHETGISGNGARLRSRCRKGHTGKSRSSGGRKAHSTQPDRHCHTGLLQPGEKMPLVSCLPKMAVTGEDED